ncbi:STAS domain-containing protein [Streptomyces sp. NPDC017943]|uniref:STAS domain-containing protein n=1 Tax=Streptomyces sp. NPDC017943 TaxID=3365019 RepID=UPI0037A1DEB5
MNVTTAVNGTSARIHARGEIDFHTLTPLRAAVAALPPQVTELQWDLTDTAFMDVAGLHLLFNPAIGDPALRVTVTGLGRQPMWLLRLAAETNPVVFDLSRLLPGSPPACTAAA